MIQPAPQTPFLKRNFLGSPNSTSSRDECWTAHRREIKIAAKWTFSLDMRTIAPKPDNSRTNVV